MTSRYTEYLLENVSVDGDGPVIQWYGKREGSFAVFGTWDGATVTIYESLNGEAGYYQTVDGAAFTEDTNTNFEAGQSFLKAVVSGAGASTDLTCILTPQDNEGGPS